MTTRDFRIAKIALLALIGLPLAPPSAVAAQKKPKPKAVKVAEPKPLDEKSAQEIIAGYTFVGDFTLQEAERPISDEVFWRYPLGMPPIEFPIDVALKDPKVELPATRGDGRAVDHLNHGRTLFLSGQITEAKNAWLTARARFGRDFPFHRRNDYLIGMAFANIAIEDMKTRGVGFDDDIVRGTFANAATFLSWAFIVKADQPDPLVEAVTPKGLYNLAAIYWRYGRFAGAFGAADTGLNFLRKTGRTDFRPQFHRIVAEANLKNRTYLDAVQELDLAIRQDKDLKQAAASFARVGDIYFDLNNYDLAEDAYGLGAKIDEDLRQINPSQLVLRGESLFWLGKFSEAQKILHFALEGASYRNVVQPLPDEYAAWAALRIADSYLARHEMEKAKLEYYKVGHQYRSSLAGRLAKVREACLELPFYDGNNIRHARELLEEAKAGPDLPPLAVELGWACQVGSYTDRERTPEMLNRVKLFADSYPESRFLRSFETPVREFQASHIDEYFANGDVFGALSFFEKTRKMLFPKVSETLAVRLFESYADVHRSASAAEFWDVYRKQPASDLKALRQVTVATEMALTKNAKPIWAKREAELVKELDKREWTIRPESLPVSYVERLMSEVRVDNHLSWLQKLAQHWGGLDSNLTCDLEYTLLSKIYDKRPAARGLVMTRLSKIIAATMPDLFKQDESCALSLLELESRGLRSAPAKLAGRYIERRNWPLVGGFLHLFWTIAEHVNDDGDRTSATQMWEVIRDKGPVAAPEVQFAKARLDPARTEFEKLWD